MTAGARQVAVDARPGLSTRGEIRALGGLAIAGNAGEELALIGKPYRCALLLLLAVEGRPTRDTLVGRLWPDKAPAKARRLLSQTLYELRHDVPADWVDARGETPALTGAVRVDARDFEDLVQAGQSVESLRLYRGEFLAGVFLSVSKPFELWVDSVRARLQRLHRRARRSALDELRGRDPDAALALARDWAEIEPTDEEAQLKLIELLALGGRRAEALEQYERYERLLSADDDGLEPMAELKALVASIRSGTLIRPAAAVVAHARPADGDVLPTVGDVGPAIGAMPGAVAAEAADAAAASQPDMSIAVLPFANLSAEAEEAYLSDGIADELIYALARVSGLRTTPRTSSFALRDRGMNAREIGRELGVRWLVEGSIRKAEDRVRITAQLLDTRDETPLWLDRYDERVHDVLAIQEEIAGSIAASLVDQLGIPAVAPISRETVSPDAYNHYLLGRYHWNRRDPAGLERAVQAFQTSLEHDAGYARTYAGLAHAYIAQAQFGYREPLVVMPLAEAAADQALSLDATLSEAHTARAHILDAYHWRWDDADAEYRRAISLDPRNGTAYAWYSGMLCALGEHERAEDLMRRALALEPLSTAIVFQLGANRYRARQYERALALLNQCHEMDPQFFAATAFSALAHTAAGRPELAAELSEKALQQLPAPPMLMTLGQALAALGRVEEAEAAARRIEDLADRHFVPAALPAIVHAWLGRTDDALAWIRRAAIQRHGQFIFVAVDPAFDPLRPDARFGDVLREMGLDGVASGAPSAAAVEAGTARRIPEPRTGS